jgi:hypothetical protein
MKPEATISLREAGIVTVSDLVTRLHGGVVNPTGFHFIQSNPWNRP